MNGDGVIGDGVIGDGVKKKISKKAEGGLQHSYTQRRREDETRREEAAGAGVS